MTGMHLLPTSRSGPNSHHWTALQPRIRVLAPKRRRPTCRQSKAWFHRYWQPLRTAPRSAPEVVPPSMRPARRAPIRPVKAQWTPTGVQRVEASVHPVCLAPSWRHPHLKHQAEEPPHSAIERTHAQPQTMRSTAARPSSLRPNPALRSQPPSLEGVQRVSIPHPNLRTTRPPPLGLHSGLNLHPSRQPRESGHRQAPCPATLAMRPQPKRLQPWRLCQRSHQRQGYPLPPCPTLPRLAPRRPTPPAVPKSRLPLQDRQPPRLRDETTI